MTDLAAIKERYDDIIRRLDAPKMGNPKYLTDRVQIEGELRSLTRKLLALLADTPSVEPLDEALAILDVIDGIVDDTHPEGDGCPLCAALDELRDILGGTTR